MQVAESGMLASAVPSPDVDSFILAKKSGLLLRNLN